MTLKPECGVTKISLTNALELLARNGRPDRIELALGEPSVGGVHPFRTTVEWYVPASQNTGSEIRWHTFTGFSWGFRGTGPRGLQSFLIAVNLSLPEDVIAEIPMRRPGVVAEFNRRSFEWTRVYHDNTEGTPT